MRRRAFLQAAGISVLGLLADGHDTLAMPDGRIRPSTEAVGVLHDSSRCTGCRKCEAACQSVNADILPLPEIPFTDLTVLEAKRRTTIRNFTVVNGYRQGGRHPVFRKQQCNHCLEPACASACPVRALVKTPEGPVLYRPDLCLGCRYCMVACPWYVPAFDYHNALNPLIYKCTLCHPRLSRGLLPGCVEACPQEALTFGKRSDLLRIARERIIAYPDRYVSHIYGETERGGTSWLYLSPVGHEKLGQPVLNSRPIPEIMSGMPAGAAILAVMSPAVLGGIYAISRYQESTARRRTERAVQRAISQSERGRAGQPGSNPEDGSPNKRAVAGPPKGDE